MTFRKWGQETLGLRRRHGLREHRLTAVVSHTRFAPGPSGSHHPRFQALLGK